MTFGDFYVRHYTTTYEFMLFVGEDLDSACYIPTIIGFLYIHTYIRDINFVFNLIAKEIVTLLKYCG